MADPAKLQALKNLSAALPVANSKVAAGQTAARQMQIQNAVKAVPVGAVTAPTAQETGAAAAQQAGQQKVQAAQQNVQQQGQIGQVGLQEQNTANQNQIQSLQQGSREQQTSAVERLGNLDAKLKQDIYDKNIQFQKDETGRTVLNETQMADYARVNAQNDQQYQNYAQTAQQASQRNLELMNVAHQKIMEDLDVRYEKAKQAGDQATMRDIANMKYETDQRMQREQARAANSAAAWTAGGTVLGGALGSLAGPAGAQAGAGVGGALGGMANALGG